MSRLKRLMVTGAAGFIGARFVESCNHRGISVVSVDDAGHFSSRKEHRGLEFGEIVDREKIGAWLEDPENRGTIDGVVHMGACSKTTTTDAAYVRKMNVEASQLLWNYCAREKLPFVYASSAATYGGGELGYDDDESAMSDLKPLNLYGASKLEFDLWALSEERAGRAPSSWSGFKFFNVYGFGERHKGPQASVVLHAHDQLREKGSIRLFKSHRAGIADGEQKRDFVYVDDVVRVLRFALEKPIRRGIFNLGTGEARAFLDLARAVCRSEGVSEKIEFVDTPIEIRDKYQYFTQANMKRLREEGYREPFTKLEDGVNRYLERLASSTNAG